MVIVDGRIIEEIEQIEEINSQKVANQLTEGVYIIFEQNNHLDYCNVWLIKPNSDKLLTRTDAIYTRHARYLSEIINSSTVKEAILDGLDKIADLKRLTMQELATWKVDTSKALAEKISSLKSEDTWLRKNIESIYQSCRMGEMNLFLYKLNPY